MIYSKRLVTTGGNEDVFYSTDDGTNGGNVQESAITTIILCNTAAGDPIDETVGSATVTLFLVKQGESASPTNTIVKNLVVPAEETIFLSEERIVLGEGDYVVASANVANRISVTVSVLKV